MASQEPESSTSGSERKSAGGTVERKKYIYALAIAIIALFLIIYLFF